MKSVTAIAAVCISAPSVALAAILADHTWGFTNAPSDGLDSVRFPFRVANAPHEPGFFFAQDFHFTNVDKRGGFLGLQPVEDFDKKPFIRAIFSTFVEGAIPQSGNCREGAKVGPGVSCSIEWQHDYGDRYSIDVVNLGDDIWRGSMVDLTTGASAHIGQWKLPLDPETSRTGDLAISSTISGPSILSRARLCRGRRSRSSTPRLTRVTPVVDTCPSPRNSGIV